MMRKRISEAEVGKKYGRLIVTKVVGKNGLVECICDCGNIKTE